MGLGGDTGPILVSDQNGARDRSLNFAGRFPWALAPLGQGLDPSTMLRAGFRAKKQHSATKKLYRHSD